MTKCRTATKFWRNLHILRYYSITQKCNQDFAKFNTIIRINIIFGCTRKIICLKTDEKTWHHLKLLTKIDCSIMYWHNSTVDHMNTMFFPCTQFYLVFPKMIPPENRKNIFRTICVIPIITNLSIYTNTVRVVRKFYVMNYHTSMINSKSIRNIIHV